MTLRDHKGRENIVERFVNDLFSWVLHFIGWLLRMLFVTILLVLITAGLAQCLSDKAQASPGQPTQPRETHSCTFSRNF